MPVLISAGLNWIDIKSKLESEGSKNVQYDSDLDGVIDNADKVDGRNFWVQDTEPDNPNIGDMWLKPSSKEFYVYV